jgi:hypothetical protein
MGQKLIAYYKAIGDEVGMAGKVKLAQATKIPSTKAALTPDSPENIEIFKKAFAEIVGKPAPEL